MANDRKKTQLIRTLEEGSQRLDILGHVVWWNIRNVDIPRESFIAILEQAGLPTSYAKPHNYRSALTRALKQLHEKRIIRVVEDNSERYVVQFTSESIVELGEGENELRYDPETRIVIDKNRYSDWSGQEDAFEKALLRDKTIKRDQDGQPVTDEKGSFVRMPDPQPVKNLKDRLVSLFYLERDKYNSSDVTRFIQKIFDTQADIISLRKQGTVYFVPSAYANVINSVTHMVDSLNEESAFERIPLVDVPSNRQLVGRAFSEDADALIEKLDEDIHEASDGEKSPKWLETRQKTVNKLRERLEMYAQVLDGKRKDNLESALQDADQLLQNVRILDI